jgi:N-hydroxyarylamine O-acetyltransferase
MGPISPDYFEMAPSGREVPFSYGQGAFQRSLPMSDDFLPDLDSYFSRIGHDGSCAPTLETLRALHLAHALTVPFENLTVLEGERVLLDPDAVERKLVMQKRGGYCFEQNGYFVNVLRALGFDVVTLIARVRWMMPEEIDTARTHMLLLIHLPEGEFIADVGFGSLTMTAPVRFALDREQETPHEPRRLVSHADGYELQAKLGSEWAPVYRFSLEPARRSDYEVANWHTSTHPASIFTQHLIVTRPFANHRATLFNTGLTIRYLDGRVETHTLETPAEIAEVLGSTFGLVLSGEQQARMIAPHFARWHAGLG